MGTGILVCGLNGCGKSTLGKALAEAMGVALIDIEDLYFPDTDASYRYANPRTQDEVQARLLDEIQACEHFVLASVKGEYGEAICRSFRYAVLMRAPKSIRMQRIRARSRQKFGSRMLPGGDLYEQEERFFASADGRDEHTVEEWAKCLHCPIIAVDGTNPVADNVQFILRQINAAEGG